VDRPQLLDALELRPEDLRRPVGRLSRGTRQKINIVQGLQHRPHLIVLDEPTEGLDPLVKRALFHLLHAARGRGATVFFSSHVLGEVQELCDRVALIRGGQLVAVDRIDDLRAHLQRRVTVQIAGDPPAVEQALAALPAVSGLAHREGRWQFLTGDPVAALRLLAALPVTDVAIEPPSLEDVFLQYYRREHVEAA
jgi:ABC-2 type transport system ATP-binding protein